VSWAPPRLAVVIAAAAVLTTGCGGAPILANEPIVFPSPPTATEAPARQPDPIPVQLPRDDGPHDRLTEWWYYTGHLRTVPDGRRYGFEAVVFRAERGGVPVAWASHLALTDEAAQRFTYAQRSEIGPQVDRSPRADGIPSGFDLEVSGVNPALIAGGASARATSPWRLSGSGGTDRIEAALSPEEAGASGRAFGLALDLRSTKPAAMHDGDGFVDFGDAGSSYYYSRTRLATSGTLTVDGAPVEVEGIAWFDHQWGDFISVGGGWNWFAVNLDDGNDLTVSQVLDSQTNQILIYGTIVDADGTARGIAGESFGLVTNPFLTWHSPVSGRTWATGWTIFGPLASGEELRLEMTATVPSQELDTRPTTGVVYWEGSHTVSGRYGGFVNDDTGQLEGGTDVTGDAYVEMTRYDAILN
jgi:predicted secreted hydrolase